MMENEEFVQFLKSTLVKIENVIFLLQDPQPKHIPAYNKMLGVQQKLAGLDKERKAQMFSQLIATRSIVNCFMNGRYGPCFCYILTLRQDLVNICLKIEKNERDKNE